MKINTSNPNKLKDFQRLFSDSTLEVTTFDLQEPDATPLEVIASKATQVGEGVLVQDTSLDVDGVDIGVNVKWLQDSLHLYVGKPATFTVLIGIVINNQVHVYKGEVSGTIVPASGDGFGFDPVFKPNSSNKTLAEYKPDCFNARALAVQAFLNEEVHCICDLLYWKGKWQA